MSCNNEIHLRTPLTGSYVPVSAFSSPSWRSTGPSRSWLKSGPGLSPLAWWQASSGGGCGTARGGECEKIRVDLGYQSSYHKETPSGPGFAAAICPGELIAGGERRLK